MKKLLLLLFIVVNSLFANTIPLTSGNEKPGSITKGEMQYYKITAKKNETFKTIMNHLSADADLYVKVGEKPTSNNFDCKSEEGDKHDETCTLKVKSNSDVFIGVYGFETANYRIKATLSVPNNETITLNSNVPVDGFVVKDAMKYYKISANMNQSISALLSQLSADADLYVKVGEKPTTNNFDCKSENGDKSNETCLLPISENIDVFIGVYGFETASYTIKATLKLNEPLPTSMVYENAEDQKIERWTITDNIPNGATVSNVYDSDKASRVITFTGVDSYENQYQIGGNWNNSSNKNLIFDLKTTEGYIIDVTVSTPNGERYLRYTDNDLSFIESDIDTIIHGLGYFSTDGTWHTHRRDLEKDLKDLEPNNTISSVDSFAIRAIASLDNLELFTSPKTVYENAEDQQSGRWRIESGSQDAIIENQYNPSKASRVISFQGDNALNYYIIGAKVDENGAWNDRTHNNLKFSFNSSEDFAIYLFVKTQNGNRELKYTNQAISQKSIQNSEISFGLGETSADGKWHTFIRDIRTDIKYFENNNKLLSIEGLRVVGNSKIDDLELFTIFKEENHSAGYALTFDDYDVDGWYSLKDSYLKYNTKATFFVSNFHTLSALEIDKLKSLEQDGHEIGCHTYDHKGVGRDFHYDANRINEYLNTQIKPAYDNMKNAGFNPISFAYPFGEQNEAYDNAVKTYFPYLRTTASDNNRRLFQLNEIFHKKGKHYTILAGDGIDNSYDNDINEIKEAFIKARENGEIITLYGHQVLDDPSNHYAVSPEKLKSLMRIAQEVGLKSYTFSQAYTVGQ